MSSFEFEGSEPTETRSPRPRQPAASSGNLPITAGVLILGLAALGIAGWFLLKPGTDPSKTNPAAEIFSTATGGHMADNWTYKEMLAHINSKTGLNLKMVNSTPGTVFTSSITKERLNPEFVDYYYKNGIEYDGVIVEKLRDTESARQTAGKSTRNCVNWGRWYIESMGDEPLMDKIKKVLK